MFHYFLLGWLKFGIHIWLISPFPCRSLLHLLLLYHFKCHLYFPLWNIETWYETWGVKHIKKIMRCWEAKHTPSTCFPSCSATHGHQPRTAFWEKRELGRGFFKEAEFSIPGNIFRLHFSGLLAGGMRLSRSNSTEPIKEITTDFWDQTIFFLYLLMHTTVLNQLMPFYLSSHPARICHCPISG